MHSNVNCDDAAVFFYSSFCVIKQSFDKGLFEVTFTAFAIEIQELLYAGQKAFNAINSRFNFKNTFQELW